MVMGIMTANTPEHYENIIRGVPYGLKYRYLANGAPEDPSCFETCSNRCYCATRSTNEHVCRGGRQQWWGCWDVNSGGKPGADLRRLLTSSEAAGQIPMVVYYTSYQTIAEGAGALPAGLTHRDNVRDYFRDWRFMLTLVDEYQKERNKPVMIHIEPDLWGSAQQGGPGRNGPENLPVEVQYAAEGDCPEQENNFAGFGICMVRMARHYAPQALIGFMASGWATGVDINLNTSANMDIEGVAVSAGEYLNKLGANLGDFLVVEFSDRDAGFYEIEQNQPTRWYDVNNQSFPNFHRTFLWGKTLADTVKLPLVWWQIPMGHMGLSNSQRGCRQNCTWRDNRVEYLFSHLNEVAATQSIALAFGPGDGAQTNPITDGGFLAGRVRAYAATSGQPLVCIDP